MKTITVSLFFLFVTFALSAQTSKGSFLIGGNGSLSFNKNDYDASGGTKSTTFSTTPFAGYFIIPNLCAGMSLPLSWSWSKSKLGAPLAITSKSTSSTYGVGPFVRYYIPIKSFFIVTEGSYSWYRTEAHYTTTDVSTGAIYDQEDINRIHGYNFAAGPAFFLSHYTSIEILANYGHTNYNSHSTSDFFVSIGFQIYLPSGSGKE